MFSENLRFFFVFNQKSTTNDKFQKDRFDYLSRKFIFYGKIDFDVSNFLIQSWNWKFVFTLFIKNSDIFIRN